MTRVFHSSQLDSWTAALRVLPRILDLAPPALERRVVTGVFDVLCALPCIERYALPMLL